MTDNGPCYKSFAFRDACKALGLKHIRTRPYTPRTNGKAERCIQTALREWAYAQSYPTSDRRAASQSGFICQTALKIKLARRNTLYRYNCHRPHGSVSPKHPSVASA